MREGKLRVDRRWAGTPRTQGADKSADLRWFPLDALPEPIVTHGFPTA